MHALSRDFSPILSLMRDCFAWLTVRWRLFDIQRIRGDFMHDDLPDLVIAERELRP